MNCTPISAVTVRIAAGVAREMSSWTAGPSRSMSPTRAGALPWVKAPTLTVSICSPWAV